MMVDIDPVLFSLGPIQIRWYGLAYVVGFFNGGLILRYLARRGFFPVAEKTVDSLITYLLVGMFLGARLAYVFIYNWDYYQHNLTELLSVWKGGLSFHGAVVGMVLGALVFARRQGLALICVTDSMALAGAQGSFFGRLGNFINGELYGRITEVPWGMVFREGGPYPRHPSQIYQALTEGVLLSLTLWAFFKWGRHRPGTLTAVFLAGHGILRFAVEFFRQPDRELGYYFSWMTMGQILCALMILTGAFVWVYTGRFYSSSVTSNR